MTGNVAGVGAGKGYYQIYDPPYYQPVDRLMPPRAEIIKKIEELNGGEKTPEAKKAVEKYKDALIKWEQNNYDRMEGNRMVDSVQGDVKPLVKAYRDNVPVIYEARGKMDTADSSTDDYLRLLRNLREKYLPKLSSKYRKALAGDINEKEAIWRKYHEKK